MARYLIDMHDVVVCGRSRVGIYPPFRSAALVGRNIFDALPSHSRTLILEAADRARNEQTETTVPRVPSAADPTVMRIVHCAPGRRAGDVMITVYETCPNDDDALEATNN